MSTSTQDRNRQPRGRPVGGEFAETTKPASGIALAGMDEPGACITCGQPTEIDANEVAYHLTIDGECDYETDADHEARPDNGPQAVQVAPGPTWSAQEVEDFVESSSDHLLASLERFEVAEPEVEYVRYPVITGDHEQVTGIYADDVDGDYDEEHVQRLREEFTQFVTDNNHLIDAAIQQRPELYGQHKTKFAEDFMVSRTRNNHDGFAYRSLYGVGEQLHAAADAYPDVRPQYDPEERVINIVEVPKGTNPHLPYLD